MCSQPASDSRQARSRALAGQAQAVALERLLLGHKYPAVATEKLHYGETPHSLVSVNEEVLTGYRMPVGCRRPEDAAKPLCPLPALA